MGENWHLFWQNQIPSEQAAWGGLGPRGQGKGAGNRKTSPRVHWANKHGRPVGLQGCSVAAARGQREPRQRLCWFGKNEPIDRDQAGTAGLRPSCACRLYVWMGWQGAWLPTCRKLRGPGCMLSSRLRGRGGSGSKSVHQRSTEVGCCCQS